MDSYDKDILMVTHSRDEVYRFCDTIHVLEEGCVAASGKTKEVFRNPRTVAAAKLTGCKNITKAQVLDSHTLRIPEWETDLHFGREVPKDTTFIGIRAHYLRKPEADEPENIVTCRNGRILDDPFEIVAVFDRDIWWKIAKEDFKRDYHERLPDRLVVPEDGVLFLH